MSKLTLKDILAAIDYGAKDVWNEFSETDRKEVSFWLLNRWVSSVTGSRDHVELAVLKVNEYYNKNWNVLGARHPKLQWQLLCIAGGTNKIERHVWIGHKKKNNNDSKIINFIQNHYPNMKLDEVELLARISTKEEIRELARNLGYEKRDFPV